MTQKPGSEMGTGDELKIKNPISQLLFFLTEKGRVIVGKLTAGVMAVRPIWVGVFFVFG